MLIMLSMRLRQASQSHRKWLLPACLMQTSAANCTHQQSPAKRPLRYEAYFRRRDHITDEYKLVYKAPMELVIAGCKHLSTFSLAVAAALVSYKYATEEQLSDVMANKQIVFGPLMSDADELLWFGVAFVVFNVAILAACDRVPLRIYRKQNDYVAMFEGLIPLTARPFPFVSGEVQETVKRSILPWHESMYLMRKRSVILLAPCFKTPSELNEMMRQSTSSQIETTIKPRKY